MEPQEEKNVQQETNEQQAKPVKRVLTATVLRHQPGMAVQTHVKAGPTPPESKRQPPPQALPKGGLG